MTEDELIIEKARCERLVEEHKIKSQDILDAMARECEGITLRWAMYGFIAGVITGGFIMGVLVP